ncbi:MAG: Rne/Rng family ribonuclease [Victivallaceae bacterium]|nr:Rne/Rng family ribonuclease [Victivallaceae bacterium]
MEKVKKQIIFNAEELETSCALLNNGKLEEYHIERSYDAPVSGSVYLGRIVNLETSLQAAFVDIGVEKNAFLHYWDMIPATFDLDSDEMNEVDERALDDDGKPKKKTNIAEKLRMFLRTSAKRSKKLRENEKSRRKNKITIKDIPSLFRPGTELLVQVVKGPIGTKGARVTTNISIPGRYLVLLPYSDHIGLSTKIEKSSERSRLRKILKELDIPEGMGMICRTVGEGRKAIYFQHDLNMLLDMWQRVEEALEKPKIPAVVYSEPTLLERSIRDIMTEDINEIVVNTKPAFDLVNETLNKFGGKRLASKVKLYSRPTPIFEAFKIQQQVEDIFKREVSLPNGGYICIDETEALIAIDVNTGKGGAKRTGDQPEVILQTNLEAAAEVARQLRLRNIGGQVVIDFIDMRSAKDRDTVYKHMRKLVKDDRAKTHVLALSRFGLMEMTRQREHESLKDTVYVKCPYCHGSGHIKSEISMSVEIQRRLHTVLRSHRGKEVRVIMHPEVLGRLKNEDEQLFRDLESKFGRALSFRADDLVHHEEFKLVDPVSGKEYH